VRNAVPAITMTAFGLLVGGNLEALEGMESEGQTRLAADNAVALFTVVVNAFVFVNTESGPTRSAVV